jgi:hypothetical protein
MEFESKKNELIRLCLEFPAIEGIDVVIPRAYIPWVPDNWNGLLVLAEAQNLSETNRGYVERLTKMSEKKQVCRLYESEDGSNLGIEPWDDGSLKLAVEAALGELWSRTAVSNAVLWSQVSDTGANQTPAEKLAQASCELWSHMLPVLQPKSVVSAGKIANGVVDVAKQKSGCSFEHIKLRLPSPNAMSRTSGMFKQADLLRRFPEVASVVSKNPKWVEKHALNKVFYACHAVSLREKQT